MVGGIAARVRRPRPAGPAPPALSDDESDFEEEEYRRRQRSTAAGKRQKGKGAVAPNRRSLILGFMESCISS